MPDDQVRILVGDIGPRNNGHRQSAGSCQNRSSAVHVAMLCLHRQCFPAGDLFALAVQDLLDFLTHSERFYSGMEPEPVDDPATAHPAGNTRADRDDLISHARPATIRPAHRVNVE